MVKDRITELKKYLPVIHSFADEMMSPLFVTNWGVRTSQVVFSIFSILFLIGFIQMFFVWHDDVAIARLPNNVLTNTSDALLASINQIPQAHLFGSTVSQGFVPITSLQLRLVGITKSSNDEDSRVIISESGSPGKVYAIGDSLPSGIRVYAINNDGVIFENSNHLEKLPLARERLTFGSMPKSMWSGNDEN